jgi:hypothetical protein
LVVVVAGKQGHEEASSVVSGGNEAKSVKNIFIDQFLDILTSAKYNKIAVVSKKLQTV